MLLRNEVFQFGSSRVRILWVDKKHVYYIDIDKDNALPQVLLRHMVENIYIKNDLTKINDPHISFSMAAPKTKSKAKSVQESAWVAIKDIVSVEPEIYIRKYRGELFSSALESSGVTKQTLYRWLRRYWQFGLSKSALSGRYQNCGAAGKRRLSGSKKRGAPRTRSQGTGVNVDENIKALFRVVIEKYYLNESKYEFSYAYDQVLSSYCVSRPISAEDLNEVPTERQFRYFYQTEYNSLEITRKREGEINYLKDFRPILSSSTAEVSGPGSRYQIDATIGDVYLVSEEDRENIIGRPTIYFVVDVFSRIIAGVYVGLENASWVSAMEALTNADSDKVEFCRTYGIEITEEMWPCMGMPENIIGDRGEMLGRHVEVLSESFHVNIENTAPYRADYKGIVERYFRTIQTKMKPFVEGYVTKNPIGKKRKGKDYRQDGIHTLKEFTQIIIKIILFYNNHNNIEGYDAHEDVPANLPHVPITLWDWGIENRTGRLRSYPEDLVNVNLLPHTTARITEHGISLFKCFYTCERAINLGWFDRNFSGEKNIEVAYDFYSGNKIYLRTGSNYSDYIEAELTQRSRAYRNMTIWEIWVVNEIKANVKTQAQQSKRAASVNLLNDLEDIVARSRDDFPNHLLKSNAERVRGINENKRKEKDYERKKKAESLSKSGTEYSELSTKEEKNVDYSIPIQLSPLLKSGRDDE